MRKLLFTLVLCGLWGLHPAHSKHRPWMGSVEAALAEAKQQDRFVLVDLYADWCGWCKKLENEVFSSPEFQEFARDFVLLRVDTEDGGEGTRLQQQYEAYSLPTTLVLDANRVMIADIKGFAPANTYIASVQRGIEAYEELVRGYEKFRNAPDVRVLAILADEFSRRSDTERATVLYRQILASDQTSVEQAITIQYQLADSLRRGGIYDQALDEAHQARSLAAREGNTALAERLELLAAQIAIDRGDCKGAEAALQQFLGSHPESQYSRTARKTLKTLKSDGFECI